MLNLFIIISIRFSNALYRSAICKRSHCFSFELALFDRPAWAISNFITDSTIASEDKLVVSAMLMENVCHYANTNYNDSLLCDWRPIKAVSFTVPVEIVSKGGLIHVHSGERPIDAVH